MGAIEQFDSRLGSAGSGNWNRTRRFHITVDSLVPVDKQDPLADSELPEMFTGHATFPGVLVTGYTLVERLSIRDWIVEVNYGVPPLLTPSYGGMWKISVSSSLESERQDVTTRDSQQIEDGVVPIIVGSHEYAELKSPNDYSGTVYQARSRVFDPATGEITDIVKDLKRLDLRKREGMQVTKPVATLTLQNRFYHPVNYGQALARVTMVNDSNFFGAAPGQLKFSSVSANSFLIDKNLYGFEVGFDVVLNFQWKTDDHQHTIMHQYEDPDNPEIVSPVLRDGKPVMESLSRYLETSFASILSGFTQVP